MTANTGMGYSTFNGAVTEDAEKRSFRNAEGATYTNYRVEYEYDSYLSACADTPLSIPATFDDGCKSYEFEYTTTRGSTTTGVQKKHFSAIGQINETGNGVYGKRSNYGRTRRDYADDPCDYQSESSQENAHWRVNPGGGVFAGNTKIFTTTIRATERRVRTRNTTFSTLEKSAEPGVCIYPAGPVEQPYEHFFASIVYTTETSIFREGGADTKGNYYSTQLSTTKIYTVVGTSENTTTYLKFRLVDSIYNTFIGKQTRPVLDYDYTTVTTTKPIIVETNKLYHAEYGSYRIKDNHLGYSPNNFHYSIDGDGRRIAVFASKEIVYKSPQLPFAGNNVQYKINVTDDSTKYSYSDRVQTSWTYRAERVPVQLKTAITSTTTSKYRGSYQKTQSSFEYLTIFINSLKEINSETRSKNSTAWANYEPKAITSKNVIVDKIGYELSNFKVLSYGVKTFVKNGIMMYRKASYTNIPTYKDLEYGTSVTTRSSFNYTIAGRYEIIPAGTFRKYRTEGYTKAIGSTKNDGRPTYDYNKLYEDSSRRICISEVSNNDPFVFGVAQSTSDKSIIPAIYDKHLFSDIGKDFIYENNMFGMHVTPIGLDINGNSYISIKRSVSDVEYTYRTGSSIKTGLFNTLHQRLIEHYYSYSGTRADYNTYVFQTTYIVTREVVDSAKGITRTVENVKQTSGINFSSSEQTTTQYRTLMKGNGGIYNHYLITNQKPEINKDYTLKIAYADTEDVPKHKYIDIRREDIAKLTKIEQELVRTYNTILELYGSRQNASAVKVSVNFNSYLYKYAKKHSITKLDWDEDERKIATFQAPIDIKTYAGQDFETNYVIGGADYTNGQEPKKYYLQSVKYLAVYESGTFDNSPAIHRITFKDIPIAYIEPNWEEVKGDVAFEDEGKVTFLREKPISYDIKEKVTYEDQYTTDLGEQLPVFTKFDNEVKFY